MEATCGPAVKIQEACGMSLCERVQILFCVQSMSNTKHLVVDAEEYCIVKTVKDDKPHQKMCTLYTVDISSLAF